MSHGKPHAVGVVRHDGVGPDRLVAVNQHNGNRQAMKESFEFARDGRVGPYHDAIGAEYAQARVCQTTSDTGPSEGWPDRAYDYSLVVTNVSSQDEASYQHVISSLNDSSRGDVFYDGTFPTDLIELKQSYAGLPLGAFQDDRIAAGT